MTYTEKLQDPRWQKKRLHILNRDNWCCQLCNDTETTLHIHHKKYLPRLEPWSYKDDYLITYCAHCHSVVEYFKNSNKVVAIRKTSNGQGLYFLAASCHDLIDATNNLFFFYYRKESGLEYIVQMTENSIHYLTNHFNKQNG